MYWLFQGTWQFLSVNALRYPRPQPEIADALESFFHVLLYCAIRFLPHTCNYVSQFIHRFFDRSEAGGLMGYTCSMHKALVMRCGCVVSAATGPIIFLSRPRTPEETVATLAAREKIPSPSLQLSGPSALSSDVTVVNRRHPIDRIFATLLRWFNARYELMEPRSCGAPDVAWLKAAAGNLTTHSDILHFLTVMLYSQEWYEKWPLDDKQPDQLVRDFNLDPEEGHLRGKRKDREDDTLGPESQAESKRICSAASQG